MKRTIAIGCLVAPSLICLLGIAACGGGGGGGDGASPSVATPDASVDAVAPIGRSPVITLVNDLTAFQSSQARLCASVGGEQLFAASIIVPFGAATPLALPAEAGAKLTGAVTFHLVPPTITDACVDAVKRTADGVYALPELPAGAFVADKPYAYMLLGCEASPDGLPAECSADATPTPPAPNVSTLRGRVVALDDGAIDAASIGLQFINNSQHLDPSTSGPGRLRATATGGWNDGPKPIGASLVSGATPALATKIPSVGFLAPSNGGFKLETADAIGVQLVAQKSAAELTDVTFAAGKGYVVTTVGREGLGGIGLLVFPTFPTTTSTGTPDTGTTGPQSFVSLFNDVYDDAGPSTFGNFVPCFITADGTVLNPSPAGASAKVLRHFQPAPIITSLGGRWATDEIRLVQIPDGSAHACDASVVAAIGVDGVRVLNTFAQGTFAVNRSYMVAILGCSNVVDFASTPWCYPNWNGQSGGGGVTGGIRYVVYEVDGAPAANAVGFQYMQASAFVQWDLGRLSVAPAALTGYVIGTQTRFDVGFSSYASTASPNPQVVTPTATRIPDAVFADLSKAYMRLTVSDGNGGYADAPFDVLGAYFGEVEQSATGKAPTFTFFTKGHNYVLVTVTRGAPTTMPNLVAVPTTW